MKFIATFILTIIFATAGCAAGGPSKQELGTGTGAVIGGLLGSQIGAGRGRTVAIIGGALLGGIIGNNIGKQLDERDRLLMAQSTQNTLEYAGTGDTTTWRNPDTGASGTTTPTQTTTRNGQPCREFTTTIKVGGRTEQGYGTACRDAAGDWQVQS